MYCIIFTVLLISFRMFANVFGSDELSNEIFYRFEYSSAKNSDAQVWNAIQTLNTTIQRYKEFQIQNYNVESRDAMINSRIGIFIFTRYCGPGARILNRFFKTDERTYASIDNCCRMHDECPDYVLRPEDYEKYPNLDQKPQFFSRLKCSCDVAFYQCLEDIQNSYGYAYAIGVGYGIFQHYCFEYEYPIVKCTEYFTGFGLKRCFAYQLDYDSPKMWQWFDVLPPYLEVYSFPQLIQNAFSSS